MKNKTYEIKKSITFLLALVFLYSTQLIGQTVSIVDHGATPNDPSDDDKSAISSAIAACSSLSDPILLFPEGTYHINSASGSGTYFYINGIDNFTIEGKGSTIEFMGLKYNRHVFEFRNCKNLTVQNLNIDYQEIPFSQGEVVNTGSNFMDVKIMAGFNPQGKAIRAYAQYDNITGQQINNNEDFGTTSWTWLDQDNNIIRVNENTHNYSSGMYILMRHAQYDGYSFIVGGGCEDVVLDNITVFLAPGYPFYINGGAKNVSYLNCNIKKKGENFWATSTVDGAHLLDARGKILFDSCYFENMCDDGINLHGYFHSITQSINSKSIRVQSPQSWYTASGYIVGDTVEFFNSETQQSIAINVISNISNRSGNSMTLDFENDVPAFPNGISNYKMANISILGSLTVTNSTFKANRARGILVSTSDVLIENCTFDRTMMSAILFEVSNYWNESRTGKNVIIRNNTFDDCGHFRTDKDYGIVDFGASISSSTTICDVFKNISITGNTFKNIGIPAIYAKHIAQLEISHNTIASSAIGRNLIRFGECNYPVVENNIGAVIDNMGDNCTPGIAVTGVSISPTISILFTDETKQLTAIITPSNTPDTSVIWASDKPSVATVDTNGLVSAVAEGTATITAITNDGTFTASSTIFVNPASIGTNVALGIAPAFSSVQSPNDKLTDGLIDEANRWTALTQYAQSPQWAVIDLGANYDLNKFEVYPYSGRAYQYTIEVSFNGTSYTNVIDRTSNTTGGIVIGDTVSTAGRFVRITVTGASEYSGGWVTINELMVYGNLSPPVNATGVSLIPDTTLLAPNETEQLEVIMSPENASNSVVNWESDNASVVIVDNSGLIKAIADGTANVIATTDDGGFKDTCAVTVTSIKVSGVSLNRTSVTFKQGQQVQLRAIIDPFDATDSFVSWESDNISVATVSTSGRVIAVADGTANITVTTNDGGFTATCVVTVSTNTTSIEIIDNNLNTINIFPNPIIDIINIDFDEQFQNPVVSIIDFTGRELQNQQLTVGNNVLDLGSIAHGVYILVLKDQNNIVAQQKIIKQ